MRLLTQQLQLLQMRHLLKRQPRRQPRPIHHRQQPQLPQKQLTEKHHLTMLLPQQLQQHLISTTH